MAEKPVWEKTNKSGFGHARMEGSSANRMDISLTGGNKQKLTGKHFVKRVLFRSILQIKYYSLQKIITKSNVIGL